MIQPFPVDAIKGSRDGPTVIDPAAHSQVSNRLGFFSQIISTIRRKCACGSHLGRSGSFITTRVISLCQNSSRSGRSVKCQCNLTPCTLPNRLARRQHPVGFAELLIDLLGRMTFFLPCHRILLEGQRNRQHGILVQPGACHL